MAEKSTSEEIKSPENSEPVQPISTSETVSPALVAGNSEKNPARNSAGKNPIREKLLRATGATLEKFGFRKGRGRPKKCTTCGGGGCDTCNWTGFEPSKSDVPAAAETVVVDADEENLSSDVPLVAAAAVETRIPAAAEIPAEVVQDFRGDIDKLFHRIISNGAKGSVEGAKKVVRLASLASGNDESFTEKTLAAVNPAPDALDDFSDSIRLVVKNRKPSVEKNGDLWCAGISGVRIFAPMGLAVFELVKEARRRNALLAKNSSQPKPENKTP